MMGALLLALLSLAWAGPVGVQSPDGLDDARAARRVALLFGVDDYQDPALVDLSYAAKDARELGAVLADPRVGGFDQVVTLADDPTRDELLDAIAQLNQELHSDDTLLLFFAGHGTMDLFGGETELFLLASDAELDRPQSTGVRLGDLERLLQSLRPRRRVLIVDACYNGEGRSAVNADTEALLRSMRGGAPTPTLLDLGRMDARLFAARPTDPAIESSALGNGVYTHFLIRALEGEGDVDRDGVVDVHEAHEWARDRTLRYTDGLQVPWIQIDEQGRLPIWLAGDPAKRSAATRAILTGLESLPTSAVLRVDGVPRGGGGLEAGWRRIEVLVDGEAVVDREVYVRPAERVAVEGLVAWSERAWRLELGGAWMPSGATPLRSPALGQLRLSGWPASPGLARLVWDLQVGGAVGPVADFNSLPTLDAQAGLRCMVGQQLRVGPRLGVGGLWRFAEQGTQLGPVGAASLSGELGLGAWHLGVDAGVVAPLLPVDEARVWQPSVGAWVGVRL